MIAVGAAVPAMAASPPVTTTYTTPGKSTLTIPAGNRTATFTVIGAGGASTSKTEGGAAASIEGTLALAGTTATTLTIVVGAGGNTSGVGGAGYGNGGSSATALVAGDVGRGAAAGARSSMALPSWSQLEVGVVQERVRRRATRWSSVQAGTLLRPVPRPLRP